MRILLAAILLTAAGLKAYQLATEPILGTSILDSRWLLIGVVEFELFFGLWLIAGLLPRLTWLGSLGCFGLFASVSLYRALNGAASCGCFGRVEINPWFTFTLDLACALALLRWRPDGMWQSLRAGPRPADFFILRVSVVAGLWLVVGLPGDIVKCWV